MRTKQTASKEQGRIYSAQEHCPPLAKQPNGLEFLLREAPTVGMRLVGHESRSRCQSPSESSTCDLCTNLGTCDRGTGSEYTQARGNWLEVPK